MTTTDHPKMPATTQQRAASPCTNVCTLDEASGLCQGCLRTLDEIRLWGKADDNFKRRVWADIEDRLAEYTV